MKRIAIISAIIALVLFTTAGFASPLLKLDVAKYDPYPVEAGQYAKIWIKAENTGSDPVTDATFVLEPEYPFYLDPSETGVRAYGRISSQTDLLLEYKVRVDKDALNGTSKIKLKYQLEAGKSWLEKTFDITVTNKPRNPELVPLFSGITPIAYPGGKSELTVDIANVAPGTAYYIIVEASTLAAVIEKNKVFVGTLEADDFDSVSFELEFKNVTPGEYPVFLKAVYKNEDYDTVVSEGNVTITLLSKKEALSKITEPTPVWYYLAYLVVIVLLFRFFIIPWAKKTHHFIWKRRK